MQSSSSSCSPESAQETSELLSEDPDLREDQVFSDGWPLYDSDCEMDEDCIWSNSDEWFPDEDGNCRVALEN